MSKSHSHVWQPIADLPPDWRESLVNTHTSAIVQAWLERSQSLRQAELYREFLGRLRREWAIETGAIEGLYTLSEGATLALIEKGLDAAFISHEDTNDDPHVVIAKIQDQHHALEGLYQFISGERPLGTSYVRELHQVLTAHQETYIGRDQFGIPRENPLPRGTWKLLPNNVQLPDGTMFEYSPPEQVASEMDRLIAWHHEHEQAGVPPDVEAAWLHHRFSLIHPFTDGNGRVARCLATLVLLKAHWLPLVVTRRNRADYILALRKADDGDLRPLVEFFGELQRDAVLEALNLSQNLTGPESTVRGVLELAKERLKTKSTELSERTRTAFASADKLHEYARNRLEQVRTEFLESMKASYPPIVARLEDARRNSPNAAFSSVQRSLTTQVFPSGQRADSYESWTKMTIESSRRFEILFSFHNIGHPDDAILGCTGAYISLAVDSGPMPVIDEYDSLDNKTFTFTSMEDSAKLLKRFSRWLEPCLVKGLDYWQRTL